MIAAMTTSGSFFKSSDEPRIPKAISVQVDQGEHSITSYIEGYAMLRSMVGLFLHASIIVNPS